MGEHAPRKIKYKKKKMKKKSKEKERPHLLGIETRAELEKKKKKNAMTDIKVGEQRNLFWELYRKQNKMLQIQEIIHQSLLF